MVWTSLALSIIVGALFAARLPIRREPSWAPIIQALPAVLISVCASTLAPQPEEWSVPAILLFVGGGVVAAIALVSLGRSFAILPAVRGVVARGPYQIVRHPAYAGELLMLVGCFVARPSWAAGAVLALGVPLVVLRIDAEEQMLRSEPSYLTYTARVRWRLIPLVW